MGDTERKVYKLVAPGRDVRKLIDLSCLGEFETCKALCNLVNLEYLRPSCPPTARRAPRRDGTCSERAWGGRGGRCVDRLVVLALLWLRALAHRPRSR